MRANHDSRPTTKLHSDTGFNDFCTERVKLCLVGFFTISREKEIGSTPRVDHDDSRQHSIQQSDKSQRLVESLRLPMCAIQVFLIGMVSLKWEEDAWLATGSYFLSNRISCLSLTASIVTGPNRVSDIPH